MKSNKLICFDNDVDFNNYFLLAFQRVIDKTKLKTFYVSGFNLDWRNSNGSMFIENNDAGRIINLIQPKTNDISIDVFKPNEFIKKYGWRDYLPLDRYKCKFMVVIYHHDCPTGSKMLFFSTKYGKEFKSK